MTDNECTFDSALAAYKAGNLQWKRLLGSKRFDYPIDYSIAVLRIDEAEQRVDIVSKWAPNHYCHFHRHLGPTTSIVLEGEHHVNERSATQTVHKTRTPGHRARSPGGDVHEEYGGKEGSVVFFSMTAHEGQMFEVLDRDRNILRTISFKEFTAGEY